MENLITSYSQIPQSAKNAFMNGLHKVRYIGNYTYRCFGVEHKIAFGECPEVFFYNFFKRK